METRGVTSGPLEKILRKINNGDSGSLELLITSCMARREITGYELTALARCAAALGKTDCLYVISKHGVSLTGSISVAAASGGHVSCLQIARERGDEWTEAVTEAAAFKGHSTCLAYLLAQKCPVGSNTIDVAVSNGHVTCVTLLVADGLPDKPFLYEPSGWDGAPAGPEITRCLQHLLDEKRPIHQKTLVSAVKRGDVNLVRVLHDGGVPLWDEAWEMDLQGQPGEDSQACALASLAGGIEYRVQGNIIVIPRTPERYTDMRTSLMYASCKGAPVTPVIEEMFWATRAVTRAVLLCFHIAAKLSESGSHEAERARGLHEVGNVSREGSGDGNENEAPSVCNRGMRAEERAVWAAMAKMPPDLVDIILVSAEIEIPESTRKRVPVKRSGRVQLRSPDAWSANRVRAYETCDRGGGSA